MGPKVFVSYAHESDEHKAQVLALATFLRRVGVGAVLDLWAAGSRRDWYSWAVREMTDSDFVLVVASKRYRVMGDGNGPNAEHRGVQSEAALLRELVYGDRAVWLPKVLPVVLPGQDVGQIPLFLQPHTASRFHVDSFDTTGAEELLRVIFGQPGHLMPAVSTEKLVLPPRADTPVRRPRLTSDLERALQEFALEVRLRLQDETQPRQALGPSPLAVRWKNADSGLSDHPAHVTASAGGAEPAHVDLVGRFGEIAEFYRTIPSRRLVILGGQGSGKTTLAIRFVVDTLGHRTPLDPVPVIVNIGSWNPARTGLREWLGGRLIQDYPALAAAAPGGTVAKALVGTHHILPVLDGFDEIAPGLQSLAMAELNRAGLPLAAGFPLVLTSRPEEYRRAVEADVLAAAAVVQLDTLTPADLVAYLPLSTRPAANAGTDSATVWAPVIARLGTTPLDAAGTNVAMALETPLMVWLARTIYRGTSGRDPAELLDTDRFRCPDAIQEYLIENYVPAVYERHGDERPHDGPAWEPRQVRTWLHNLARHAQHRDTTDIAWWQIGTTTSLWARSVIVALLTGLTIGVVVGLATLIATAAPSTALAPPVVTIALVDAVVAGTLLGAAYGVSRRNRNTAPAPSRIRFRGGRRGVVKPAVRLRSIVVMAVLGGFAFGIGIAFQALLLGTEGGIVPAGAVLRVVVANIIVFGTLWAVAIGIAATVMTWLESPADIRSAATPETFLRFHRRTVLTQMLLGGPILGVMVSVGRRPIGDFVAHLLRTFAPSLVDGFELYWAPGYWFYDIADFVAGAFGSAVAFAVVMTAWGHWLIFARFWLPLTGRLPWNLMAFLDDAYRRGVLRQPGPFYQFRHKLLQSHLADTTP